MIENFSDVIGLWPSVRELAEEIGEKVNTVDGWRKRNSIPSWAWSDVVVAAESRDFGDVTPELLTQLASKRKTAA